MTHLILVAHPDPASGWAWLGVAFIIVTVSSVLTEHWRRLG